MGSPYHNLITDIDGITVGNAHDPKARTGVTVILCDRPYISACAIPGGGPGTRETDALQAGNLVECADAIVLSGGSVYGLDAAGAVTAALGKAGRGYQTGAALASPIVPAAILFDLSNGGEVTPDHGNLYRHLGQAAFDACDVTFDQGNSGAGYGARAGLIKGGLGSASIQTSHCGIIGAIIAANPFGSVVDGRGQLYSQSLAKEFDGQLEFGPSRMATEPPAAHNILAGTKAAQAFPGGNTTIGVVACSADLTRDEALRVAIMAQDGLARAIRPIHTPFDGDALFVLATGTDKLSQDPAERALQLTIIGAEAADCVARSVGHAVWRAETLGDIQALSSLN